MTQMTQINPETLNVASQMILKEINLTGTDAERKAKLDKFEADWKALTGASDMKGARFVGNYEGDLLIMAYSFANDEYEGICYGSTQQMCDRYTLGLGGSLIVTHLFSHLEPVEIFDDNSIESKKKNIDNINAYKANLEELGVDINKSFQVPIYRKSNSGVEESGFLIYSNLPHVYKPYSGLFLTVDETSFSIFGISSTGEFIEQTYYATLEDVRQANTLTEALKDLHTPIAISTDNTTDSKAQNVRNMADFVAKAKAAGIADVNGMAVTCTIRDEYFGVGYFGNVGNGFICGIVSFDDVSNPYTFVVDNGGQYIENEVLTATATNLVTSSMLTQGARKPIILTSDTTEVDEGTYQKLMSDDVDVVFKDYNNFITLFRKSTDGTNLNLIFSQGLSTKEVTADDCWCSYITVSIRMTPRHTLTSSKTNVNLKRILKNSGYLDQSTISPVLQKIDLTVNDVKRKAQLDQFEIDWKALTGASDLGGARFVGIIDDENTPPTKCVFTYDPNNNAYWGLSAGSEEDDVVRKIYVDCVDGSLIITPLFSHLEPVNIVTLDASSFHKMNLDNLNAYKSNLENLGVDTSKTFQVPFTADDNTRVGNLHYEGGLNKYLGVSYESRTGKVFHSEIDATGKYTETLLALDKDVQAVNTPVPLTTATSTNKTQLDLFLSKVPNAQVMHCTYKDVYAGTLHKINGSWYGVLVGESNTIAGQLSIKLQADGTIVEGTA